MNVHTTDVTPMKVRVGRGARHRNRRGVVQAGVVGGLATALSATGLTGAFAQGTPDAVSNRNVELIERYYETYAQGDPKALREFFASDIVWRIPGQHPLVGDKRGADEVLAFFAQLARAGFAAETIELAAGGDWVIDLHRGYSTTGEGTLDITWALAFRIQDEQIAEATNWCAGVHSPAPAAGSATPRLRRVPPPISHRLGTNRGVVLALCRHVAGY